MFCKLVRDDITLRLYEERNAEEMFAVIDANRDYLRKFLPWLDKNQEPEDVRVFIRRSLEQFAHGKGYNAGIWEGERFIGGVGMHAINEVNRNTSIGYWLAADCQGRGIMTACCLRVLRDCFEDYDLHRVWLEAASTNLPSRAVARRIGMVEEGVKRQSHWVSGRWLDMVQYGILREEWEAQEHL